MPDPIYKGTLPHFELIRLIRQHNWKAGAEIGVRKGRTFAALLEAFQNLTMICVDQWEHLPPCDVEGSETYAKRDMAADYATAMDKAKAFGKRARIIRADSVVAALQVEDNSLDFVFIDGGHTYEQVMADLAAWAPKVGDGGWLTGHDWEWPTVAAALDDSLFHWSPGAEQVWAAPKTALRPQ